MTLHKFKRRICQSSDNVELERSFHEWTVRVMAGMKRMDSDIEYRTKIQALAANAAPIATMQNGDSHEQEGEGDS